MLSTERAEILIRRIHLIKKLISVRDKFSETPHYKYQISNNSYHIYQDYSGLRNYLALTCFDIIGQPSEWLDFTSWLKSKTKSYEREQIFEKHHQKEPITKMIAINEDYNKIYGVKSSFYRFLNEIISKENKEKLMKSVWVFKINEPDENGWTGAGVLYHPGNEAKEKFLFEVRNSFTHKGISYSDSIANSIDPNLTKAKQLLLDRQDGRLANSVIKKENLNYYQYCTSKWPFLLLEIIEETIIPLISPPLILLPR